PEHAARVRDEHVQVVDALEQVVSERSDRVEAGEVERHDVDLAVAGTAADLLDGAGAARRVTRGDDDVVTVSGETDRGLLADTGVPAGDDDRPAHAGSVARLSSTAAPRTRARRVREGRALLLDGDRRLGAVRRAGARLRLQLGWHVGD